MNEWLERLDWEENPFNFKIYPELMVGYGDEISAISDAIEAGNKFSMILGQTGAGKTNLLKWLVSRYEDEFDVYYMPKPPTTNEDLLEFLEREILQPGLIDRWFNDYTLYNIYDELEAELEGQSLLVVDECHEASTDVLRWIRTAIDHVDDLTVVAAGLPSFERTLKEDIPTLHSRATAIVRLESLDRDESFELVRQRIETVGGRSLEPFTRDAVLEIYQRTGGFPREILRACNDCVVKGAREDVSLIDVNDVERFVNVNDMVDRAEPDDDDADVEEGDAEPTTDTGDGTSDAGQDEDGDPDAEPAADPADGRRPDWREMNLTDKQERVMEVLEDSGESTSGEIADAMGTDEYTSRDHAVRSINNILNRLRENDLVERERQGRSYAYRLAG